MQNANVGESDWVHSVMAENGWEMKDKNGWKEWRVVWVGARFMVFRVRDVTVWEKCVQRSGQWKMLIVGGILWMEINHYDNLFLVYVPATRLISQITTSQLSILSVNLCCVIFHNTIFFIPNKAHRIINICKAIFLVLLSHDVSIKVRVEKSHF